MWVSKREPESWGVNVLVVGQGLAQLGGINSTITVDVK